MISKTVVLNALGPAIQSLQGVPKFIWILAKPDIDAHSQAQHRRGYRSGSQSDRRGRLDRGKGYRPACSTALQSVHQTSERVRACADKRSSPSSPIVSDSGAGSRSSRTTHATVRPLRRAGRGRASKRLDVKGRSEMVEETRPRARSASFRP